MFLNKCKATLALAQYISGNLLQTIFKKYLEVCQIYRNTSQYTMKLFVCVISNTILLWFLKSKKNKKKKKYKSTSA